MKKIISCLLMLSIMLSLFVGTAVSASAEEASVLELTGVYDGELTVGQSLPTTLETCRWVTASGTTEMEVEFHWYESTPETNFTYIGEGVVRENCTYMLDIQVKGLALFDVDYIYIDGVDHGTAGWDAMNGGNFDTIHLSKYYSVNSDNVIYYVDVMVRDSAVEVGAAMDIPEVVSAYDYFSLNTVRWLDQDKSAASGSFQDGLTYYLEINLTARDGYLFSEYLEPGVDCLGFVSSMDSYTVNSDGSLSVYVKYCFGPQIGQMDITVAVPGAGVTAAAPTVPADALYTVKSYAWYDVDTGDEVTVFEDGRTYWLAMELSSAEGYIFAYEPGVDILVNGERLGSYTYSANLIDAQWEYSLKKTIDKLEITVPEPVEGQTPDVSAIKLSSDKCTVQSAQWYEEGAWEALTGAFAHGKAYQLDMQIVAAEGYTFTEETQITVNGKEYGNWHLSSELQVFHYVSFKDMITAVDIPALPQIKTGMSTSDALINAENEKYTLGSYWIGYDPATGESEYEPQTFEDGKAYYLTVYARPANGFEFSENAVVTVAGAAPTTRQISVTAERVNLIKLYALGLRVIDTVELSGTLPEDGKTVGTLTVADDAAYALEACTWGVYQENLDDVEELKSTDVFKLGSCYAAGAYLYAKDGYVFSDNLKVTINAEEQEIVTDLSYYNLREAMLVLDLGKLEEKAQQTTNPQTGDEFMLVPMALLAVLSAMGLAVTLLAYKKREQ